MGAAGGSHRSHASADTSGVEILPAASAPTWAQAGLLPVPVMPLVLGQAL